jgi:hypothetical protein
MQRQDNSRYAIVLSPERREKKEERMPGKSVKFGLEMERFNAD